MLHDLQGNRQDGLVIIEPNDLEAIQDLIRRAALQPVYMPTLEKRLENPRQRAAHRKLVTDLSIVLATCRPHPLQLCYTIETGHPCGVARHLSVSVVSEERLLPTPFLMETLMPLFGFFGDLSDTTSYVDRLSVGGCALNLLQPVLAITEPPPGGKPN